MPLGFLPAKKKLLRRYKMEEFSELDAAAGAQSRCRELQTLGIDPQAFSGPHPTGDVYAVLVADAPSSTVLRFKCTGCPTQAQ